MMFMRHISLCIILQLVHTENCADLKNVEFAGSIIIQTFFLFISFKMQFSEEKKSSSGQGRSESKKKNFFFLGSGPKIGSVGTWETDNQLDVPLNHFLTSLNQFQKLDTLRQGTSKCRENSLFSRWTLYPPSCDVNDIIDT